MAKTDNINVRVDPIKKSRVLKILKKIDKSMTDMVNKMLDEIYYTKGDPFDGNKNESKN